MSTTGEFGSLRHLAERFYGALSSAGPSPAEEQWAIDQLLPGERELWRRMSGPDRRHAVAVAQESLRLFADADIAPGRDVVAAALMHDAGKIPSGARHLCARGRHACRACPRTPPPRATGGR